LPASRGETTESISYVASGDVSKTHELRELSMACVEIDATLEASLEPAAALSQFAWQFRYPGEPYEPDANEAAQGRALAEVVRTEILKRLPSLPATERNG
jgi:hypothetical protein